MFIIAAHVWLGGLKIALSGIRVSQFFSALSFLFPCPVVRCCQFVLGLAQAAAYAPDPLPVSWSHLPVR